MKYQAVIKIRNSVRGGKQIGQSYTSELLKYPELCLVQVCALTLPCPHLQMPYLFKAQLKHHIPPQVARLLHPPTLRTNLLEDAGGPYPHTSCFTFSVDKWIPTASSSVSLVGSLLQTWGTLLCALAWRARTLEKQLLPIGAPVFLYGTCLTLCSLVGGFVTVLALVTCKTENRKL